MSISLTLYAPVPLPVPVLANMPSLPRLERRL